MEDRRYRQAGYKESGSKPSAKREEPAASPPPATTGSRHVSRCADCGTLLPPMSDPLGQCPGCKAELHSCKQCAQFDPGHRFECTQPIPERIPDKRARNDCAFFSLRVTVERSAASGAIRPQDARRAFDNLFKK